jgi:sigma-B regulation protein RsbU (phosphoserine phosphatase)
VPAAMFAATLRGLLRAAPEMATQPGALLGRVNRLLYDELSNVEMFITAQLVFVDVLSRRIITANAGHCPVLLQSPLRKNISAIAPDGLPLGILPDTTFYDQTADLEARSRLILYTDGLTDAQSSSSECFGQPRLLQWLEKTSARNAAELKESLAAELNNFRGTTALADDLTFLIFAEAL